MTLTVCEIFIAFKPLPMNGVNLGQYGAMLEILTNPATDIKSSNILGKKSTAIFAFHLLLFQDKISSFSGKVASHKPVERKTTKRGTKLDPYV